MIFLKNHFKSILWAGIILYLSIANLNDNVVFKEFLFPYSDKFAHFGIYAVFSWILLSENKKNEKILIPLLISISYGILMEILQYSLTTYRSFEVLDIVANSLGAFSFWYFYIKNILQI